jgi:hypothetical protein
MDLNYLLVIGYIEMQINRATIAQHAVANKLALLIIIAASVIAILWIPVILPHITHPSMIYHIFLHAISVIIALFLSTVSILA